LINQSEGNVMTRSRFNTRETHPNAAGRRHGHRHPVLRQLPLASAISAILAGAPAAHAAEAEANTLEEVVVTAQKRTENLQDVPISIEVLDNTKLEQLHVVSLDDYVKYSPSIAYSRSEGQGGNGQPGTSHIYMRGVVSGANPALAPVVVSTRRGARLVSAALHHEVRANPGNLKLSGHRAEPGAFSDLSSGWRLM